MNSSVKNPAFDKLKAGFAKNGEKKDPAQPVLIRLGIPPFLRSHKGVAVYDSTGKTD